MKPEQLEKLRQVLKSEFDNMQFALGTIDPLDYKTLFIDNIITAMSEGEGESVRDCGTCEYGEWRDSRDQDCMLPYACLDCTIRTMDTDNWTQAG